MQKRLTVAAHLLLLERPKRGHHCASHPIQPELTIITLSLGFNSPPLGISHLSGQGITLTPENSHPARWEAQETTYMLNMCTKKLGIPCMPKC